MTIIIKLTDEDLCNVSKIGAEIDSSLPASIADVTCNHYTFDTGAVKIDSNDKICTIDIESKFLTYLTNPILDIISMCKMMGRTIMRMFDDKFGSFFKDDVAITKNGKPIDTASPVEGMDFGVPDMSDIKASMDKKVPTGEIKVYDV